MARSDNKAKAKRENAVTYWGDETGMRNDSQHEHGYAPKGTTVKQLAPSLDDYLVDDCHFNDQGKKARAALIFNHIEQDLPKELLN